MKNIIHLTCLLLISTTVFGQKQFPSNYQPGTYMPGRIIFKLLPETRSALVMEEGQPKTYRLTDATLQKICAAQGQYSVKALFPHHWGRETGRVDLSLIGEIIFDETANVPALCQRLMATGQFEYVEPRMIYKTGGKPPANWADNLPSLALPPFIPNDPMLQQQWHLEKIKAFDAWDIEQGDTSVLIAIVDTGVDYNHPDLKDNIAVNYGEIPNNNFDDDGNGFDDDYYGWDFHFEDNDPSPGASHGTAVAGVAAAVTNNGLGLAAPGFNSRIVCVKVASDTPGDLSITHGLEGVVYAAERGCRIINCSFGGPGFNLGLWADIIEYATFIKNALIVSISHNYNNEILNYPASEEHVISVAATNQSDVREPYSNFNHLVDISAPSNIWVTTPNGNYANGWTGTSFSAPLVAGAAAILTAYDPSLTALQLGERLRMTADNIDAQNPNYIEKLGRGRLNMHRALTDPEVPAVRFSDAFFTDGNDEKFTIGDTLRMSGNFVNYLADATNLTVTLSTPNTGISFLDSTLSIGTLATMAETNNANEPFSFIIQPNIPYNAALQIRLHFQADDYDDWQWISVKVNRTSLDLNNNVITTTVTPEGRIGFDNQSDGVGFQYLPNNEILGVFGLMLGNNSFRVSDAALNHWNNEYPFSNDFKIVEPVRPATVPLADIDLYCSYNDSLAFSIMGLSIHQNTYAWMGDHFIIAEYEITNNSNNEYNTFHAGLWAELDVLSYVQNRAEQDTALNLGYVYHASQLGPYTGIQLLGPSPYNLYAYDYTTGSGSVHLYNNGGFSSEEKYITLTANRPSAGFGNPDGEDVGLVVSSGPYQLAPGGTIKVAFALLAADNLELLQSASEEANLRYNGLNPSNDVTSLNKTQPLKIYPNPSKSYINIQLPEPITTPNEISLFDAQGKLVELAAPTTGGQLDVHGLSPGLYVLKMVDDGHVHIGRFVKQ